MNKPARVLIVDDHPAIRAGAREILSSVDDLVIVGAVGTAKEALDMACREHAALALVDLRLPDMDGTRLIAALLEARPGLRAIAFSSYCKPEMVRRAVEAGARGYLLKDAPPQELREAIRSVLSGRRVLAPRATRALAEAGPSHDLTPRESAVLAQMCLGLNTKEIAAALSITQGTVGVHIGRVLHKLGVPSRARAVALALALGLVDDRCLSEII
jgi:two-component system nitrate/nitrite response regulator NarL